MRFKGVCLGHSRELGTRLEKKESLDSPKGERTGSSDVSPLGVCWDQQGVRAGVLINIGEDESLVAVLEEKEVSKAWRPGRGGGGSWGKEEEGDRNTSFGLVMQRFFWLSDVLEGGLRSGADMAWDAGGMLLMVLTVDHRLVMLSRDGLPSRVITRPQLPSDARVDIAKLCPGERGGDDGGFEHQTWHENIDESSANSVNSQANSVNSQNKSQYNRGNHETAGGANMARWLQDSNSDELLPFQLMPFCAVCLSVCVCLCVWVCVCVCVCVYIYTQCIHTHTHTHTNTHKHTHTHTHTCVCVDLAYCDARRHENMFSAHKERARQAADDSGGFRVEDVCENALPVPFTGLGFRV